MGFPTNAMTWRILCWSVLVSSAEIWVWLKLETGVDTVNCFILGYNGKHVPDSYEFCQLFRRIKCPAGSFSDLNDF